ncbi:MAG TPA: HEAT repeat domain-containing protein [Planctomycetota bacterium]|nr:HEAT repeat domain-containing protein [Planctomycetota bacterium]
MTHRFFIIVSLGVALSIYGEDGAEEKLRRRFVTAYTAAQTVEGRTEAVGLLKGVREKESMRLLAGMLGDKHEAVRKAACVAISGTGDKEGYFVKPLMGALTDASRSVRAAAADALGQAEIKADAVKGLAFALLALSAEKGQVEQDAPVVEAFDAALSRLTGKKAEKPDPKDRAAFWIDHWKQNEEALRAADEKKLAIVPKSREGMAPDTFDQLDQKKP